jgi:hypothetical protein
MLVSAFPDVQSALAAVFLEANEIIVEPFENGQLAELAEDRITPSDTCEKVGQEESGRCLAKVLYQCRRRLVGAS